MQIKAIKTKILQPPQDSLFDAIIHTNFAPKERSVVAVSSKVVAIHEGRCVAVDSVSKEDLIQQESDVYVKENSRWRMCVKHGTFLTSAGIDESNSDGFYTLLPVNPHQSAKNLREFFIKEYGLKEVGVIVSDSRSMPLRYGAFGVALGWAGIEPVAYYTGKPDLFGRPSKYARINVVDSLAVAGVFAMGELSEQTPIAVIQDASHVRFVDRDTSQDLLIPPREDIYWPILKNLYE